MSSGKISIGWLFLICALFVSDGLTRAETAPPPTGTEINWQPWSETIFAQAKREHRFVLLDLQAVWCHWCHVMDAKTYRDPRVIALIQSRYIAVRADQDSHPDLASRYQDYGWPATIVFNSDGSEIVKRQGYLPPEQMISILQAIIDDPSPGPSVTREKKMTYSSKSGPPDAPQLRQQLEAGYDWKLGSWGTNQKFLNWDNVEYCLVQAQAGDAKSGKMAQQTLQAQLQLIDPVWGGVDQYSAEGDWNHPHFEKIMQFQAENIRIYGQAFAQGGEPVYLKTAEGIYGYVRGFLTSPDGVVYASQDADLVPGEHAGDYFKLNDADRRQLGIPQVDKHIYSRENGWFIEALTVLYQVTGNLRYRDEAVKAADWIIQHRSFEKDGFRHGEEKAGAISLADNLAMARAFLALHAITADKKWLSAAEQTTVFIASHFVYKVDGKSVGYAATADVFTTSLFKPKPDFDENVSLARFANMLFHYTGNPQYRRISETALQFATAPELTKARLSSVGGLLLAVQEFGSEPLHITIVGQKADQRANELFRAALSFPYIYKQMEWINGPQSGSGADAIQYPQLATSAAFICGQGTCSPPVFEKDTLLKLLKLRGLPKTYPQTE